MLIAVFREQIRRAADVERAGRLEGRHQNAFLRGQDLGGFTHELDARDHQRARGMVMAETRHLQRIRNAAPGFLGQRLQQRRGVVMRDEYRVFLFQQCNEFSLSPDLCNPSGF